MRVAAFPSHLDSNPYCDLLYRHLEDAGVVVIEGGSFTVRWLMEKRGAIDVLHFHWIERYYRHWRGGVFSWLALWRFVALITLARALGYRLAWTMHNLGSHESSNPRIDRIAATFMARNAAVAVHCRYARELLREMVPCARVRVIEHGSYRGIYEDRSSREAARESLGIDQDVLLFLFFGMIRGYKGIARLCDEFARCAGGEARLLIAGRPYEESEEALVADLMRRHGPPLITFVPEFIPDEMVAQYFKASDYCVFPYEDILTSGSVILSLGFGRPVIVPRIGCLGELEEHDVGIFYDARDAGGLRGALNTALRSEKWRIFADNASAYAEQLSWTAIAGKYLELYQSA